MKNAGEVIAGIQNSSSYIKMHDIHLLCTLWQKNHKNLIKIAFIKDNNLVIYCRHNLALLELNKESNKRDLLFIINQIKKYSPTTELKAITDISQIYIRLDRELNNPRTKDRIVPTPPPPHYYERAEGIFKNNFKDSEFFEIYERIRAVVIKNRSENEF
ncbi:hypothetical protein [uncultured Campylobacter sp.]|uniref:hypothetical protein n=1 Tax=uncultured Campylobacter sp. TaxID=218934 RepID=UPI00262C210C|nr:hypothetical protein [uncultured Campylobacter sp.]